MVHSNNSIIASVGSVKSAARISNIRNNLKSRQGGILVNYVVHCYSLYNPVVQAHFIGSSVFEFHPLYVILRIRSR